MDLQIGALIAMVITGLAGVCITYLAYRSKKEEERNE